MISIGNALLVTLALACSSTSYGQSGIQLRDISSEGSPLRASGAVSFENNASEVIPYTYRVEGSVRNLSDKAVLLMVVHFESSGVRGPSLSYTYQEDHFFGSDVLESGNFEDLRSSPLRFGDTMVNGRPVEYVAESSGPPTATAQVVFVQFVDGSIWGDSELARDALNDRVQTLQELHRLEEMFRSEGGQVFKKELSKHDDLPCINSLMSRCKDNASSTCLHDGVLTMIGAAMHRQTEMKAAARGAGGPGASFSEQP